MTDTVETQVLTGAHVHILSNFVYSMFACLQGHVQRLGGSFHIRDDGYGTREMREALIDVGELVRADVPETAGKWTLAVRLPLRCDGRDLGTVLFLLRPGDGRKGTEDTWVTLSVDVRGVDPLRHLWPTYNPHRNGTRETYHYVPVACDGETMVSQLGHILKLACSPFSF
jgi:hypothetical protein